MLALTETALKLLEEGDSHDFLRAARALALFFPPVQRSEDVSAQVIGDLPDYLSDADIDAMIAIRDEAEARAKAEEPLH